MMQSATVRILTSVLHEENVGCPEWIPPEMMSWNIGGHTDVYCFGMVMIEMLTKRRPYSGCSNPAEVYRLVGEGILPEEIEEITDAELKGIATQCLGPYSQRPTVK